MRRISVPFYRGSPGCISTRRWATAWGRTRWCEKSSITMAGDDFRQAVANVRLLSVRRSAGRLSVRFPVGHERFGSDVRPTSTAGHGRIGDGREASAHGSSFIVRRPVKSPRVRAVLKKDDRCRRTVRGHGLRPASSVSEVAVPGGSGCASCLASVLPFFGVQRGGRSPDGGAVSSCFRHIGARSLSDEGKRYLPGFGKYGSADAFRNRAAGNVRCRIESRVTGRIARFYGRGWNGEPNGRDMDGARKAPKIEIVFCDAPFPCKDSQRRRKGG